MATRDTETLQYLELRQRLKEQIRKEIRRENGGAAASSSASHEEKNKKLLPFDGNYGSFFGPSRTVIAQRVIQQSKSSSSSPLDQNQGLLAFRVFSSNHNVSSALPSKKGCSSKISGSVSEKQVCKVSVDQCLKIQNIKETRDYSFLFDDNVAVPPPAPVLGNASGCRNTHNPCAERKLASSLNCHTESKAAGFYKPGTCAGKPKSKKPFARVQDNGTSCRNTHNHCKERKLASSLNCHMQSKAAGPCKSSSSTGKPKYKPMGPKRLPSAGVANLQKKRHRRREEEEEDDDEKALSIIRKMFNTKRFAGRDDSDRNMETGFHELMKEERRSERLGRKEDEEQLRLIEEEERAEQLKKLAKKQKI